MTRFRASFVAFCLLILCATPSFSVTNQLLILVDHDETVATGCTVVTADGPFPGVEQLVTITVETFPGFTAVVSSVTRQDCVNPGTDTFGPPITIDASGWPVGVGLGTDGTDVVEAYLPGNTFAGSRTLRLGVASSTASGTDDALIETSLGAAITMPARPAAIPTLSEWGLILTALLLTAAGLWILRKHRGSAIALVLAITLLCGAGVAWAAVILDGNPSDWAGIAPLAEDAFDNATGPDLRAFFGQLEFGDVFFRIDAALVFNTDPVAQDDSFMTDEDTPLNGDVLADNGSGADSDADSDPLAVTMVNGAAFTSGSPFALPSGALLTMSSNGTFMWNPNGSYESLASGNSDADSFTYTIDDGNGGTDTATVDVTVDGVNDAPTITSDGGGATASLNAAENQTAVTTVTATDVELPAQTLTYSITGGADQGLFSIVGSTGVLTFNVAPDFETPGDAGSNNVYDVQVTVTDDGAPNLSDAQDIAVTVTDVNDAPVITSDGGGATAAVNAAENQTAVTTVTATDADLPSQTLTYSISGGADQALFSIVGSTGVLTFSAAPDFENPSDADTDNDYLVQVTVTDDGTGSLTDVQDITVTVTDVNDAPVITSDGGGAMAAVNAAENQTAVTTVTATDEDLPAQTLTFSITGGADQGLFSIVGSTGVLTFSAAPDFENPSDADTDNDYLVQVTVTDNGAPNLTDVQDITVTVTDVNDAPVITSDGGGATAAVNAAEDQAAVTTVAATDDDLPAQTLTFSITGGADQGLFSIVGSTGVLTFNAAPDFETPGDAGGNNVYDVQVTVTDDGTPNLSDVQDIAVTVTDVNDAPVITSDGGGATAAVNAAENQTAVTTVTATDEDLPAQTLTFSITGGADQGSFSIVGSTGVLTFNAAPDFEIPGDANTDNDYLVQVTVTDNGSPNLTDVQDITVTVTDAVEPAVATDDTLSGGALGNVRRSSAGLLNVLTNDSGDTLVLDAFGYDADMSGGIAGMEIGTTENGGQVTGLMDGMGAFTGEFLYNPPPGFTGVDHFDYEISNVSGNDVGRVTVVVTGMIWFIDNSAGSAGDGRLTNPFNTLAAFESANGGGGAADPAAGECVFLYSGSGNYTGGVTLLNNQILVGQGASTTLPAVCGVTAPAGSDTLPALGGTRPRVEDSASNGISLAAGNTVRGLDVGNTPNGFAVAGTSVGALSVSEVALDEGTGATRTGGAISLSGGTVSVTLDRVESLNSPGDGINVSGIGGASQFTVTGTTTVTTPTADGIDLSNSASSTFTFTGNVAVTTAGSGARGLVANTAGTVNVNGAGSTVSSTNGPAVDATSTALGMTFMSASSTNSTATGINLATVTGSFVANGGTITGSTGIGFNVNGGTASTITYAGSVTNTGGRPVSITGKSGGTTTLSGTISDTNGGSGILVQNNNSGSPTVQFTGASQTITGSSGTAIDVQGNTGATINFSNLQINNSSTNSTGLFASNNGTLNVTTGSINAGNGRGVDIDNTSLGITLTRVDSSAAGGSNPGIDLNTTTGSFTVAGDNANTARGGNGSGGTISQKAGADGGTAGLSNGVGVGVLLSNASNVSLNRMNLLGFNNWALHATNVSNLNLRYSTIGGMGGFNGGLNGTNVGQDEGSIRISNLTGTSSFQGLDISDGLEDNVVIVNTGTSVLTSFSVDDSAIHDVAPTPNGANGLLFDSEGTSANLTVQNSDFFNNLSADFLFVTNNNATSVNGVTVKTSNFGLLSTHPSWTQDAFNAVAIETNFGSQTTFSVLDNASMLRHTNVININLGTSSTAGSFLNGTISGNTIGLSGVANSGTSGTGAGIRGIWNGLGTGTVRIVNNSIREVYPNATGVILVQKTGGDSNLNATITDNTALASTNASPNIGNGIRVITNSSAPETASMCLTMSGNTALGTTPDIAPSVTGDIFVRAQSNLTTIDVYDGGFVGTPQAVLVSQNPATPDTTATTSGTGVIATRATSCPVP